MPMWVLFVCFCCVFVVGCERGDPQLVSGDIEAGSINVDVGLNGVMLIFDEAIAELDIKLVNDKNEDQGWVRRGWGRGGRGVMLLNFTGEDLEFAIQYSISATFKDEKGNEGSTLITFTTRAKVGNNDLVGLPRPE